MEFIEKNKTKRKVLVVELTEDEEKELEKIIDEVKKLITVDEIPERLNKGSCKKCAYYEYCYI